MDVIIIFSHFIICYQSCRWGETWLICLKVILIHVCGNLMFTLPYFIIIRCLFNSLNYQIRELIREIIHLNFFSNQEILESPCRLRVRSSTKKHLTFQYNYEKVHLRHLFQHFVCQGCRFNSRYPLNVSFFPNPSKYREKNLVLRPSGQKILYQFFICYSEL